VFAEWRCFLCCLQCAWTDWIILLNFATQLSYENLCLFKVLSVLIIQMPERTSVTVLRHIALSVLIATAELRPRQGPSYLQVQGRFFYPLLINEILI
jgi:hypothetical protein